MIAYTICLHKSSENDSVKPSMVFDLLASDIRKACYMLGALLAQFLTLSSAPSARVTG